MAVEVAAQEVAAAKIREEGGERYQAIKAEKTMVSAKEQNWVIVEKKVRGGDSQAATAEEKLTSGKLETLEVVEKEVGQKNVLITKTLVTTD
jgi:hypothetical protein